MFDEADLDQWRLVLRLFSKIAEWLGNVPALGKELNTSHGFIFLYSKFYFMCLFCLHICLSTWCLPGGQKVGLDAPELELETVVSSQVLWKNTQ